MNKIHKTALVDAQAELDTDVEVGPYSVIGPGVKIGKGSKLQSHVVIQGRTSVGEGNIFFSFASVGSIPQDLKYKGEASDLIIGNHNTIREYVSLNPGTAGGGMVTRVGDHNLLMMYCHIAHDCILGNSNIVANGATLGAGSMVSKDVPPFCNATGDRARLHGLNVEGLRRRGFDKAKIDSLRKAYRIIFQSKLRTKDALDRVRREIPQSPEVDQLASFVT